MRRIKVYKMWVLVISVVNAGTQHSKMTFSSTFSSRTQELLQLKNLWHSRKKFTAIPESVFDNNESVAQAKVRLLDQYPIAFTSTSTRDELINSACNHAFIRLFILEHERTYKNTRFELADERIELLKKTLKHMSQDQCKDTDTELYNALKQLNDELEEEFGELQQKEVFMRLISNKT